MNNPLRVTFSDDTKAIYHIAIGSKIKEILEDIEKETNKTVVDFEWLFH